jgi:hypothetical protein
VKARLCRIELRFMRCRHSLFVLILNGGFPSDMASTRSSSFRRWVLRFQSGSDVATDHQNHTPRVIEKPFIGAETKLGQKHFSGVGREHAATQPAHTVRLAANYETVEVKVAPIECDLEKVEQDGDAGVAARVQTSPNRRVGLEEQDVKLVNFDRSVWLDHSRSRSLAAVHFQPRFFPVSVHDCRVPSASRVVDRPCPAGQQSLTAGCQLIESLRSHLVIVQRSP